METTTQFLGEIETVITGRSHYGARIAPGEAVTLAREPENSHDANAVAVWNSQKEKVGYLPRRISFWLAPLLDAGKIEAHAVAGARHLHRHGLSPLNLNIHATQSGTDLLEPGAPVDTPLRALHEVVLGAYRGAAGWTQGDTAQDVAERLRRLSDRDLLPETELLLALLPYQARQASQRGSDEALEAVRAILRGIRIGDAMHHHNLTLFPLFVANGHEPGYLLLEEALALGVAEVREVSESGSVPELLVDNRGDKPLLIPEGEILTGAKQNRVVNVTVLVAAHSVFRLPVSCIEQGRWHHVSRSFRATHYAPMGLRAMKTAHVRENRATRGSYASDQGAVWRDVECRLAEAACASETSSLTDGYDDAGDRTRAYREALVPPGDCAGVLVATGGKPIGVDLFDCPRTLHKLWPRLSESYFMEAARGDQPGEAADFTAAKSLVDAIAAGLSSVIPPLGAGMEVEVRGRDMSGAGVYYNGYIAHLAVFAQ